jgi:Tfp pilus assembly protein PilO
MNIITPLILIIISLGTFWIYIDPNYRGQNLGDGKMSIQELQKEDLNYQNALKQSDEVKAKREALQDKNSQFNLADIERLQKLLPDNIDNIKLIINITTIAANHGLVLKDPRLDTAAVVVPDKLGKDNSKSGSVGLSFSVTASYDKFQEFLADLEKSLRLVEITGLAVTGNNTGLYDFSVNLKTYWLK